MSYTSQANLNLIRTAALEQSYASVAAQLRIDLGAEFSAMSDDGFAAVFCSQVAYDLKPYGTSTAISLDALLASPVLDCDNYARLSHKLFRVLRPLSTLRWFMIGVDHGPVGNHAQVYLNGSGIPLMLDPTVGYAVRTPDGQPAWDSIFQGLPIVASCIKSLPNARPIDASIAAFKASVYTAINGGQYRASHLRYFFDMDKEKLEQQIGYPQNWPTPDVELNS